MNTDTTNPIYKIQICAYAVCIRSEPPQQFPGGPGSRNSPVLFEKAQFSAQAEKKGDAMKEFHCQK